jgi:TolB protein
VGIDGRNLRALTRFKTGIEEANDFWPTVAPDGRVAFGRFGAGGITSQVYVMAGNGSGARPITPPELTAIPGEWTPDSRHLDVQSNGFRLNTSIYRIRADGTGLRRLTRPSLPNGDLQPNSSPDGHRIAFASDRRYPDVCCNDLYVMRSDGSGLHRVPTGDLVGVVDPDWRSAPRDDGSGAAAMATSSRALARAGSAASAGRLCAFRPELRLPGRCGTRAAFDKLGDP